MASSIRNAGFRRTTMTTSQLQEYLGIQDSLCGMMNPSDPSIGIVSMSAPSGPITWERLHQPKISVVGIEVGDQTTPVQILTNWEFERAQSCVMPLPRPDDDLYEALLGFRPSDLMELLYCNFDIRGSEVWIELIYSELIPKPDDD
jgi:hypothetical protein